MRGGRAFLLAFSIGLVVWLATAALTGEPEPWDGGWYWAVSYPLLMVVAGWLGYRVPHRAWRWAVALVLPAPLVNTIRWPSQLVWLPLEGLAALLVAVPLIACARIGALSASRGRRGAGARVSHHGETADPGPGGRRDPRSPP